MKPGNIRLKCWRNYRNSCDSEEIKDIRQQAGCSAARAFRQHIPPRSAYEKWIYKTEAGRYARKVENGPSFLLVLYVEKPVNAGNDGRNRGQNCERMLKKQGYRRIRVVTVSSAEQAFLKETCRGAEDYICFVNTEREQIARNAFGRAAEYLKEHPAEFAYSDQDQINEAGERKNPFLKPDWSPDTFASFFYTGNLAFYKRSVCEKQVWEEFQNVCRAGKEQPNREGTTTFEKLHFQFTRVFVENGCSVGHIPEVLCHEKQEYRYFLPEETRPDRGTTVQQVATGTGAVSDAGTVSVIIPSKDHAKLLEQCIQSLQKTVEPVRDMRKRLELIVVDNGSCDEQKAQIEALAQEYGVRYLYCPMEFNFSRMCNLGAEASSGEQLLFLNDDVEAFEPGWLEHMQQIVRRPHVGAVGAKLYYPDSRKIQHVGVVNYAIGPGHCFVTQEDSGDFYFGRNRFDYNYLAVTAACLLIRKDVFDEAGGFDEGLVVGYNDVDLCFTLYEKGYFNVLCNGARLYHHESLSRGYDERDLAKEKRLKAERAYLYQKHPRLEGKDPFYHPGLTKCLSDFDLDVDYYGWAEEEVPQLPVSKVERMRWDIRPEWLNPQFQLQIDEITRREDHITIRGWAYLADRENTEYVRRILLKREDGLCFCVGTRSCYKRYLKERFPEVEGMEMLAFTCDFLAQELEGAPEDYTIGMMAEHKETAELFMIFTDRKL